MPEQIENRMVVDSEWESLERPAQHSKNEKGYKEMSTGEFVLDEDALEYARDHENQEDMTDDEFVEWFFSGNWVRTEKEIFI